MKKSLLIVLVFGISLFISSMAFAAPNHGDIEDCDALEGEAYELCESYCFDKGCATDDPNGNPKSCARLKENLLKVSGTDVMPCDIVACAECASLDPATGMSTIGICNEVKSVDCVEPSLDYGEYTCDVVTLPLPGGAPACDDIPPGGMFGTFVPDCQYVGGLEFVCVKFLQGTQIPDACPSAPECTEEQLENINMPRPVE